MIIAIFSFEDFVLIFDGFNGSKFSATTVSSILILILTILGFDLLPHWSIATILTCSSTGEYLLALNFPFLTSIG